MDSWFDQAQQEQQEDTSIVKAEKPSREKGFSSQSRPSAGISANTWQVLVLLGALLLVVIAASVVLMRVSGDDKADSATSPATSTVSVDPAGQIAVAGQCELEEGEVWFAPGLMEGRKLEKEPYTCPSSTPPSSSSAP